ncbi:helicase [Candidatus Wolfebacteria bacterium]|nr:MAG: helicase [Candidatus Wolfebacteria bacterium]
MTQQEALDILKMGHNVYLTGKAGSGKTYLINKYIKYLKERDVGVAVTASTGIAATHIGGVTIHSWAGIGIKDKLTDQDIDAMEQKQYLWKRFENTEVLIIDEVSMLHSHLLDMIDQVCKLFKRNDKPFGGMQIILSGDFFQLPPISRNSEDLNFLNKSDAWSNMDLHICYLQEQHRHTDSSFLDVLNEIRSNTVSEETMNKLRRRYKKDPEGISVPTKLYTHNMDVDEMNNRELDKIDAEKYEYNMNSKGNNVLVEGLKKSCLAPANLVLKKGALVMFVKNNYEEGYVNGTTGEVIDFSIEGRPIIKIQNGKKIIADTESWIIEEEGKTKAEISQMPLRLAWAITIHKSQGMSLDAAEVDLSKSFVKGQGYVALSRVRSLSGLKLMGLNSTALQVDKGILMLDGELLDRSQKNQVEISSLENSKKETQHNAFIVNSGGTLDVKKKKNKDRYSKLSTFDKTRELLKEKKTIEEIIKERELTFGTIISHIETLLKDDAPPDIDYLYSNTKKLRDSLSEIKKAFKKSGGTKLTEVRKILKNKYSFEELRFARLFLDR